MVTSNYPEIEKKFKAWKDSLCGEDKTSLLNQLHRLTIDAAIFKVLNKMREIDSKNNLGGKLNGMIFGLIDRGYFESQMIGIRRMIDQYPMDGKRGVNSFVSILKDMKSNISLMTRENLFRLLNVEYDYSSIKKKYEKFVSSQSLGQAFSVPSDLSYWRNEGIHKSFDELSGTNPSDRKPVDQISEKWISTLIFKLEHVEVMSISDYVDKFVAHSATKDCRDGFNNDQWNVTLGMIWKANELMVRVYNTLQESIFLTGNYSFPIFIYDQFQYLDKPMISSSDVRILKDSWKEFEKEVAHWEAF